MAARAEGFGRFSLSPPTMVKKLSDGESGNSAGAGGAATPPLQQHNRSCFVGLRTGIITTVSYNACHVWSVQRMRKLCPPIICRGGWRGCSWQEQRHVPRERQLGGHRAGMLQGPRSVPGPGPATSLPLKVPRHLQSP